MPPGKLICSHTGKYVKWFQSDGHTKSYIPKENRQLAEKLAIKKYLSLLLDDLENEKKAIDFYIRHSSFQGKAEQLLIQDSEEHNSLYPEQLVHNNGFGNAVRSKSESMIEMALYMNRLPYRYECALMLGETVFYPDFTIRHPKTGAVYYWEHFGLMDNPSYSQKVYYKLQHYTIHGIIPSVQLITTYETKEHPLTMETIQKNDFFSIGLITIQNNY